MVVPGDRSAFGGVARTMIKESEQKALYY